MRVHPLVAAVLLGPPLCSCSQSGEQSQAHSLATLPADAKAVMDVERQFVAGWESKDPAVKALYAPDATMVTPGAKPLHDPRSIAEAAAKFAANRTAKLDLANATTVISNGGDLAFSQGTYTSHHTNLASGAAEASKGYYILIYKKQQDGSWKIIQDVSSPLPDDFDAPGTL